MFRACDTSGDNKVTLEEYLIAMGEMPPTDHKWAVFKYARWKRPQRTVNVPGSRDDSWSNGSTILDGLRGLRVGYACDPLTHDKILS